MRCDYGYVCSFCLNDTTTTAIYTYRPTLSHPDALTFWASGEALAARRHKELLERGEQSIYARVLQDLRERDARDSGRATAPLKAAADAVRLDTGEMDADRAFEVAKIGRAHV